MSGKNSTWSGNPYQILMEATFAGGSLDPMFQLYADQGSQTIKVFYNGSGGFGDIIVYNAIPNYSDWALFGFRWAGVGNPAKAFVAISGVLYEVDLSDPAGPLTGGSYLASAWDTGEVASALYGATGILWNGFPSSAELLLQARSPLPVSCQNATPRAVFKMDNQATAEIDATTLHNNGVRSGTGITVVDSPYP